MKIGILALQGNFASHAQVLKGLGAQIEFIKTTEQLQQVDGLVLPGGESTTLTKLLNFDLRSSIIQFAQSGNPILGTCAGLILLAKKLTDNDQFVEPLGLIDVEVERNAYGPQIHSKFDTIQLKNDQQLAKMCFIRAPKIQKIGQNVETLAKTSKNEPCAVRQGRIIALSFHPEVSGEDYFHKLAFEDLL